MSDTESIIEIDPLRLDQEWVDQPKLYHKYALELAEAKADMDAAKAELDVTYAEVAKGMRNDPEAYGYSKATDKLIEEAVPGTDEYQVALKQLNKAKHRVGILQAAVDALDHRKKALENLVWLHGQDYFSNPKAPTGMREKMNEVKKRDVRTRGRNND